MTLDIDKESPICSNLSKAPEAHPSNAADPELPRYSRSLKISDFLQDWSKGLPVVITDLLIQGSWNPQYFIDAYGDLKADVVNCETGFIKKMFVRDYFQSFLDPSARVGIWKLKVDALFFLVFFLSISWLHIRSNQSCRIGRRRKISRSCFQSYLRHFPNVFHFLTLLG